MKLQVIHGGFEPKLKVGELVEIDNIMRDPIGCASGIKVRVVGVWKSPVWMDLGWFVPPAIPPVKRTRGRTTAKKTPLQSANRSG